jgi:hypothetical protein
MPASKRFLSMLVVGLSLAACGGGGDTDASGSPAPHSEAPGQTLAADDAVALDPAVLALAAKTEVQPQFHMAPIVLDAPDGRDAIDNTASARSAPHIQRIPTGLAGVSTRRLTLQAIESDRMRMAAASSAAEGAASALAEGAIVKTYTPAQIRTAYGLPSIPPPYVSLSPRKAAWLGAGQTIYIVTALHDPNVVAELAAFNNAFGLPGCTPQQLPAGTRLPLAAAPKDGCVLSIAYTTMAGELTNIAPAYNAEWATEIALDVQWAHAIAPLARIVLIESPWPSVLPVAMAVNLANKMGPGIVSLSVCNPETSWTSAFDYVFQGSGMTYVAATGDWGEQVNWPAVNSNVLAVGGTTLADFSNSGLRTETVWGATGGGISAYVATPSYQVGGQVGLGSSGLSRRGVADVAFNADPATGQYVAIMKPGDASPSWGSFGGTSISTPQWAGLMAIANALRLQTGGTYIGVPHDLLYRKIGTDRRAYATRFLDILSGRNGSCRLCSARPGWDAPTGLGTPNAEALLGTLAGIPVEPPEVRSYSSMTVGVAGRRLDGFVSWWDPAGSPMTFGIYGAPPGMSVTTTSTTVKMRWDSPVAGSYTVYIVATNAGGLSKVYSVPVRISAS